MNIATRNKLNIISRWKKIQEKEKHYIEQVGTQHIHLKARILGYLAGDGNIYIGKTIHNRHYSIRFFPDHSSLLEPFCEAFVKVYNKAPIIKQLKNKYCVTVDSKTVLFNIISSARFGVVKWEVPFAFLSNEQSKIEWLRAFFDAEGYVGKDHIKIQTVNKKGMNQVMELLEHFGIQTNMYEYKPKNSRWRTNHILIIHTKVSRIRFLEKIGFNHSQKKQKLEQTLNFIKES
ncbi:hypothetical protein HYU16_04205 [Candidatus Woesearchaeota archaeon]|nr:hypothetical protein [Candidatus Woesearchaeota archaeon]